jgi:lysophospholipase L1-like esterase
MNDRTTSRLITLASYLEANGHRGSAIEVRKIALSSNAFPIYKGDKGKRALVLAAQEKLLEYGYHMAAGADGAFGGQTERAIKEFQTQNGLRETGFLTKGEYNLLVTGEPKRAARKRIIIAIGDSITANSWQKVPYTDSLQERVKGSRVITLGYGGKQTAFIARKLTNELKKLKRLKKKPDDIIILAGVNDIGSGKSVEHITGNLQSMYIESKEAGARVIAVKILPWHARKSSRGKEHITKAVNAWIESSPDVDVVIEGNQMRSEDPSKYEMNKTYTKDGIHPNDEGRKMLAKIIADKAFAEEEDKEEELEELEEQGTEDVPLDPSELDL